jgi:AraC-like DNA-binding protein
MKQETSTRIYQPGPALAPYIDDIRIVRSKASAGGVSKYCPPSLLQFMQIAIGEPGGHRLSKDSESQLEDKAFVAGPDLSDSFVDFPEAGGTFVEVSFRAAGVFPAFGVSCQDLRDLAVPIDDVLGPMSAELMAKTVGAQSDSRRVKIVEEVLTPYFKNRATPPEALRQAVARLYQSHGGLKVSTLAEELGVTRQHLNRLFKRWLGVSIKAAAGVLRFRQAVRLLQKNQVNDWADTASACGFYDQSHLIGAFQEFSGTSPERFRERLIGTDPIAGRMPSAPVQ